MNVAPPGVYLSAQGGVNVLLLLADNQITEIKATQRNVHSRKPPIKTDNMF